MADERRRPPYSQPSVISEQFAWLTLLALDSDELFDHYLHAFALRPNRCERDGCA
jgi:type I restriction enzyme M protein